MEALLKMFKGLGLASVFAASAALLMAGCSHGITQGSSFVPQSQPFAASDFVQPDKGGTAVKTIGFGKLPAATAGKAFAKPVPVTVTAKAANGKAITGAYAKPIKLVDSDKTGATVLLINGKPASAKVTLKSSTDKVTLKYTGLAIKPATLSATSKGAKTGKATFAPTLPNIVYAGPKVSTAAEIDLTSTTPATTGYSGAFTVTQAGWSGAFKKPFTYAGSPISGFTNNCASSYTITPGSGALGTAYTVSGKTGAVAGECALTFTGGAGKTLRVVLTFTTTSVGVNGKQATNQ
jgi:hypothetical protein